jgi:hypothetical protein
MIAPKVRYSVVNTQDGAVKNMQSCSIRPMNESPELDCPAISRSSSSHVVSGQVIPSITSYTTTAIIAKWLQRNHGFRTQLHFLSQPIRISNCPTRT